MADPVDHTLRYLEQEYHLAEGMADSLNVSDEELANIPEQTVDEIFQVIASLRSIRRRIEVETAKVYGVMPEGEGLKKAERVYQAVHGLDIDSLERKVRELSLRRVALIKKLKGGKEKAATRSKKHYDAMQQFIGQFMQDHGWVGRLQRRDNPYLSLAEVDPSTKERRELLRGIRDMIRSLPPEDASEIVRGPLVLPGFRAREGEMTLLHFIIGLGYARDHKQEADYEPLHQEISDLMLELIEIFGADISTRDTAHVVPSVDGVTGNTPLMHAVYTQNIHAARALLTYWMQRDDADEHLFLRDVLPYGGGRDALEGALGILDHKMMRVFFDTGALKFYLDHPLRNGEGLVTALFTLIGLGKTQEENIFVLEMIIYAAGQLTDKELARQYFAFYRSTGRSGYYTSLGFVACFGASGHVRRVLNQSLQYQGSLAQHLISPISIAYAGECGDAVDELEARKEQYLMKNAGRVHDILLIIRQHVSPVFMASPVREEFLAMCDAEDRFFKERLTTKFQERKPLTTCHIKDKERTSKLEKFCSATD